MCARSYDMTVFKQEVFMQWLKSYQRQMKKIKILESRESREKSLAALKKKHYLEKLKEIEELKQKLSMLEQELECYK